jgi:hypothetical protein
MEFKFGTAGACLAICTLAALHITPFFFPLSRVTISNRENQSSEHQSTTRTLEGLILERSIEQGNQIS